jgi:hypothetical protein
VLSLLAIAVSAVGAGAQVHVQGPSSSRAPYLVANAPPLVVTNVTSIATATDLVQRTGAATGVTYEIGGTPDGLGAYDNGDGTFTLLCNHEHSTTAGVVRRHGARGAYVSELIIDKTTLGVVSGEDLIVRVIDGAGVVHDALTGNGLAINRPCSADLAPITAFFDAASGLGTPDRIFMNGEEGGPTGYAFANIATGIDKGATYILPGFNLSTNGSGLTGVGAFENLLANPFAQPRTIVIGTNDGGSGIMAQSIAVYVGQKSVAGTVVDRAGLTGGTLSFVRVGAIASEIANTTTRTTTIASGMRFSLSALSSTAFSRPEDGHWNPANPREFYFATTDRLDTVTNTGSNRTIGATGTTQTGMSRLWRLRFDDLTNPALGGVIDLLIDGSKNQQKVQMLDNLTATADGRVYLQEDPGSTTYLGKVWMYDLATDALIPLLKFDPALWGELAVNGGTPGAIAPHSDSKESSGLCDVSGIVPAGPGETVLLLTAQDHTTNAALATTSSVQGGQLLILRLRAGAEAVAFGAGCGTPVLTLQPVATALPRLGAVAVSTVTNVPAGRSAVMAIGLSDSIANGIPLPLPLDALGMPTCVLYHDAAITSFSLCTTIGPGVGQYSLAIPNDPVFVGLPVFLQAWAHDNAANAFGLVLSNGVRYRIGV